LGGRGIAIWALGRYASSVGSQKINSGKMGRMLLKNLGVECFSAVQLRRDLFLEREESSPAPTPRTRFLDRSRLLVLKTACFSVY
jgi:hypothetical protein